MEIKKHYLRVTIDDDGQKTEHKIDVQTFFEALVEFEQGMEITENEDGTPVIQYGVERMQAMQEYMAKFRLLPQDLSPVEAYQIRNAVLSEMELLKKSTEKQQESPTPTDSTPLNSPENSSSDSTKISQSSTPEKDLQKIASPTPTISEPLS